MNNFDLSVNRFSLEGNFSHDLEVDGGTLADSVGIGGFVCLCLPTNRMFGNWCATSTASCLPTGYSGRTTYGQAELAPPGGWPNGDIVSVHPPTGPVGTTFHAVVRTLAETGLERH